MYKFVVVDKLGYSANLKNLASIAKRSNFKLIVGSITCKDLMWHVIDTVLHLAAETHVDLSYHHAFAFTECARRGMSTIIPTTTTVTTTTYSPSNPSLYPNSYSTPAHYSNATCWLSDVVSRPPMR